VPNEFIKVRQLYGILQFQEIESSKALALRAQESAENMELMTKDMHILALKTKSETVSMRIITLVTLFFLPGTFISVSEPFPPQYLPFQCLNSWISAS
jgi:hypothetical protein